MFSLGRTTDYFASEQSQTCTGFDPKKIYMLGEKYSGLKPRGALQNYKKVNYLKIHNFLQKTSIWDLVENPRFISEGMDRFDVNQGDLGDCWFLAAVADVAKNHELMNLIVPSDQSCYLDYAGIFHFRFWQYGRWIDVVVDDRLPTYNGQLIFLKAKRPDKFWTPLLEKAYAKLYGSYKNIEGGYISESLQDLTGGLTEIYEELLRMTTQFNFFDMMMSAYVKRSYMGCGITNSNTVEGETEGGLYTRHAYSITRIAEISDKDGRERYKLIRIRNPWGQCEWKGDWSDNWDLVDEGTKHHLLKVKDDGEFWMHYDDFVTNYTLLEICHPNPDVLKAAQEEMRHWKSFMIDGFFKNPQYVLTISGSEEKKPYRVLIGLMQKNRRFHNLPELSIGFAIYYVGNHSSSGGRLKEDFFSSRKPIYSRHMEKSKQITGHVNLPNGRYCIIPFTEDSKASCEILLRVYSEAPFNVTENDDEVGIVSRTETLTPKVSSSPDAAIKDVFRGFAGKDEEISWTELKKILDLLLKGDKQEFSREVCRSMVAMMDSDRSGKLNFHEFFDLWEKIGMWRGIFRNYDLDQSGTISGPELREALEAADTRISNRILNMLMLRYGNETGELEMEDFLHCCIKLASMIDTPQNKFYGYD
ncbi:hypothetical protein NQ318_022120 [Aromia moschata]|uniref:Uncharacterized protein n=1 Tax=Aromia moschata TaxID=1265417 RepID=A0AAV8Z5V5_9CUCU|nr:hypothetical protein NQ318_022120 [Aromia moschata]